jgi:hypothetical protein
MTTRCVLGEYCRAHGFIHGAEAEELRDRIEKCLDSFSIGDRRGHAAMLSANIRRMLDDVDARDSLAYREMLDRQMAGEPPQEDTDGTTRMSRRGVADREGGSMDRDRAAGEVVVPPVERETPHATWVECELCGLTWRRRSGSFNGQPLDWTRCPACYPTSLDALLVAVPEAQKEESRMGISGDAEPPQDLSAENLKLQLRVYQNGGNPNQPLADDLERWRLEAKSAQAQRDRLQGANNKLLREVERLKSITGDAERLRALRDTIVRFKEGTPPAPPIHNGPGKHRRAAERREVETIQKTLNVVLAEIDQGLAALSAGAATTEGA